MTLINKRNKFVCVVFFIVLFLIVLFSNRITIYANSDLLDVDYDSCQCDMFNDNDNEMWYFLSRQEIYSIGDTDYLMNSYFHLPDDVLTVSYYVNNTAKNDFNYEWTTDLSETEANDVKQSFINSMLRWNDVYYYSYDAEGIRTSNKIINIVEAYNPTEANIIIYPISEGNYSAMAQVVDGISDVELLYNEPNDPENLHHYHASLWEIHVNISEFNPSNSNYGLLKEYLGEHEMGHVLGLRDVDECCTLVNFHHHSEVLMGYGAVPSWHVPYVTYKDIAGVSITRGFHTDEDHIWMRRENENNGYDMICSLCNGVRYNVNLDAGNLTYLGHTFVDMQDSSNHNDTHTDKLLVATDGERDYFKCLSCRHIDTVKVEDTILFNQTSICKEVNIGISENIFYKILNNVSQTYEFVVTGNNSFCVKLYDKNLNEISINFVENTQQVKRIMQYFDDEIYYFKIENLSSSVNSITVDGFTYHSQYLSYSIQNDILLNTYNGIHDYYYFNSEGPGFYNIELTETRSSNEIPPYSSDSVSIYSDIPKTSLNLLQKFSYTNYDNKAQNKAGERSFIVYFPSNGYFYFDINVSTNSLSSLKIKISSLSLDRLDLFDFDEEEDDNIQVLNSNIKGDYFKRLEIKQTGKFKIEANYNGSSSNNILVVVARKENNPESPFFPLEVKMDELINVNNNYVYTNEVLEQGVYYIGYFNKDDTSSIIINFERKITQYGANHLVADSYDYSEYGSEVRFNNGARCGNTLTVGFSRFIYFDSPLNVPSISRLNYHWYSSNEAIATITEYGTLLGRSSGTVRIMAVYKNDPSITYVKEYTILLDNRVDNLVINNNDTIVYSESGQLYQVNLTDTNSYYPQNTLYNWNVMNSNNNWSYTISIWGTISLSGQDIIVIEGSSILNSKIKIRLTLTVV